MKKARQGPMPKGQSFWQTAPGLITALAALLTAIGGCVALFTTNPRLLNLVLKPSASQTAVVSQATSGYASAVSTSIAPVTLAASLAPRPVQFPDGQVVTFTDISGNTYRYTILSATLDPLPPNLLLLDMKIRVFTDYGVNFWNDSFRLSVGDQQLKPTNFTDVYVNANETSDGEVQFQVAPSVKNAMLNIILPIDMPNNVKQLQLLFP